MVDVGFGLTGAVGKQNGYIEVVLPAAEVVVLSPESEQNFFDLIWTGASCRLCVDVERGLATCKPMRSKRRDWQIDSISQAEGLELSHVTVVLALNAFQCVNGCQHWT